MRQRLSGTLVFCLLALAVLSTACPSHTSSAGAVNVDKDGLAVKGYDTVAYFTLGKPVKGKSEFSVDWKGAKWLFSSREHLEMFEKSPEKYSPRYGGY